MGNPLQLWRPQRSQEQRATTRDSTLSATTQSRERSTKRTTETTAFPPAAPPGTGTTIHHCQTRTCHTLWQPKPPPPPLSVIPRPAIPLDSLYKTPPPLLLHSPLSQDLSHTFIEKSCIAQEPAQDSQPISKLVSSATLQRERTVNILTVAANGKKK